MVKLLEEVSGKRQKTQGRFYKIKKPSQIKVEIKPKTKQIIRDKKKLYKSKYIQ